jgi:hypothetical protein
LKNNVLWDQWISYVVERNKDDQSQEYVRDIFPYYKMTQSQIQMQQKTLDCWFQMKLV